MVVLDSSAVLAWLLCERGGEAVEDALPGMISAVNVAEVAYIAIARGLTSDEVQRALRALPLEVVPFDAEQAHTAATIHARTRGLGFSLGDCACLALASHRNALALTCDTAWGAADLAIPVRLLR